MLAFQSGELDAIQSPAPADVPALESDDRFAVVRAPQLRNLWLGMVQGDEMLDNVALRQAIAHAINRDELVQFVAEGLVDEAQGLFPDALMDLSEVAYPYDPERAQELLAEAGYNGEVNLKVGAGAFSYLDNSRLFTDPYDGLVSPGEANAGELGWCHTPAGAIHSIVDLDGYEGQSIQLRWRAVTDSNTVAGAPNGMYVDNVKIEVCQ